MSVTSAASSIAIEAGFDASTLQTLRDRLYTVGNPADIGSVQAVLVDPKTRKQYGAADARRDGTVIGLPRPRN